MDKTYDKQFMEMYFAKVEQDVEKQVSPMLLAALCLTLSVCQAPSLLQNLYNPGNLAYTYVGLFNGDVGDRDLKTFGHGFVTETNNNVNCGISGSNKHKTFPEMRVLHKKSREQILKDVQNTIAPGIRAQAFVGSSKLIMTDNVLAIFWGEDRDSHLVRLVSLYRSFNHSDFMRTCRSMKKGASPGFGNFETSK